MLAIERDMGEQLHLIDEQGRRIELVFRPAGFRKVRVMIKAPTGVAIVRPEKGAIVEAGVIAKAREAAEQELKAGDAA